MSAASAVQETPAAAANEPGRTPSTVRAVAAWLSIILLFRVLAFQPFTISSSSMEPGLVTGDYIIVVKYSYGWSGASLPFGPRLGEGRLLGRPPERGDVVLFRGSDDAQKVLVKRVIGLPGDRVQVRNGAVLLNGRPLPATVRGPARDRDAPHVPVVRIDERTPEGRAYATFDRGPGHPGDGSGVHLVPAGHYFMLGDNRDNSLDSRWRAGPGMGVGLVPAENIVGEARLVLVSWRAGASLFKPWTWLALSPDRFLRKVR